MDNFGISHAMLAMVEMYRRGARRTGRTTELLDNLKDGDRVICGSPAAAKDLRLRIRERGLSVEVQEIEPKQAARIMEKRNSFGRTILDHTWVEEYFELSVRQAINEIDQLQQFASQAPQEPPGKMNLLNHSRFR